METNDTLKKKKKINRYLCAAGGMGTAEDVRGAIVGSV
jgi:hypothetical protein